MALPPEFRFYSNWQPPTRELKALSARHRRVFLLEYRCFESDFRRQMLIQDGDVIEHVQRIGYQGPCYLFAGMIHPLVDLFPTYLRRHTLAQHAAERVEE